jgi:hypothetical protein
LGRTSCRRRSQKHRMLCSPRCYED